MAKEKNSINLLKVIAIIFVICMHVISKSISNYQVSTFKYNFLNGLDIILKSAVPIFVLISGNLLLNKKIKYKKLFFKLIKYYLFFIIFNSIYKLSDSVVIMHQSIDFNLIKTIIIDSLKLHSIYQMWYFHIIFLTYIFIPVFKFFINKNNKIIDIIVLLVLLFLFQILPWIIPVFYKDYTYLLVFLTYFY